MGYLFKKKKQFEEAIKYYNEAINLNSKDKMLSKISDNLYKLLKQNHKEVLYDDTLESPGAKFANMDLIGIPTQIIIGENYLKDQTLEIKDRKTKRIIKIK